MVRRHIRWSLKPCKGHRTRSCLNARGSRGISRSSHLHPTSWLRESELSLPYDALNSTTFLLGLYLFGSALFLLLEWIHITHTQVKRNVKPTNSTLQVQFKINMFEKPIFRKKKRNVVSSKIRQYFWIRFLSTFLPWKSGHFTAQFLKNKQTYTLYHASFP